MSPRSDPCGCGTAPAGAPSAPRSASCRRRRLRLSSPSSLGFRADPSPLRGAYTRAPEGSNIGVARAGRRRIGSPGAAPTRRTMKKILVPAVALALLVAPPAASAVTGELISGAVTITGANGKDELAVEVRGGPNAPSTIVVTPAATVTGTGSCSPELDPQTGRPVRNVCTVANAGLQSLTVVLRGGDDTVRVDEDGL